MALKPKIVKSCGHSGCALNTLQCCGCEDTRPVAKFYPCYIDGMGYTTNNKDQTRFKDYCPPCRKQFQRLRPGMKRCSCGVVSCDLTTEKCCVCLDPRYRSLPCNRLIPGKWSRGYCPTCKDRLTLLPTLRELRKSRTQVPSPDNRTGSTSSSQVSNNSVSTPMPEKITALATPLQAQLVPTDTAVAIESESNVPSSEAPLKDGPTAVVSEFSDVADYEIVSQADVSCAVQATSGLDTCVKMGKSVGGWFSWR